MKKIFLLISLGTLFAACNRDYGAYDNYSGQYRSSDSSSRDQDADWQITSRVKAALMSDSALSTSARFVSVTTNDGVVTLTGTAASKEELSYIERKVKSVSGVRKVDNQLTIKS